MENMVHDGAKLMKIFKKNSTAKTFLEN